MINPYIFDAAKLHKADKRLFYAMGYGGHKVLQRRIDDEGCGAVFATMHFDECTELLHMAARFASLYGAGPVKLRKVNPNNGDT